jgi:hypothetical protein
MRHACNSILVLLIAVVFSSCRDNPNLGTRLQAAGGADALKSECLGFVTAYEAMSVPHFTWFPGQTNFPPTIAAMQPRALQVGRQGDVILVHMSFVISPRPYGIYVAPRSCPSDFLPARPSGSRISKIAEGVFQYED